MVNIDYNRLVPGSYQMKNYNKVIDYDERSQFDLRIAPIKEQFLKTEIRRPFFTPEHYKCQPTNLIKAIYIT